eukprot:1423820-Prymnesium_polylepis.1
MGRASEGAACCSTRSEAKRFPVRPFRPHTPHVEFPECGESSGMCGATTDLGPVSGVPRRYAFTCYVLGRSEWPVADTGHRASFEGCLRPPSCAWAARCECYSLYRYRLQCKAVRIVLCSLQLTRSSPSWRRVCQFAVFDHMRTRTLTITLKNFPPTHT